MILLTWTRNPRLNSLTSLLEIWKEFFCLSTPRGLTSGYSLATVPTGFQSSYNLYSKVKTVGSPTAESPSLKDQCRPPRGWTMRHKRLLRGE